MALVTVHVVGALLALGAGGVALTARLGGPAHRAAGKLYLLGWAALALSGALIGLRRPGLSAFEVLNAVGFASALFAYGVVLFRRRVGRRWLQLHLDWMLTSLAGLWVATLNQILGRAALALELPYPLWFFILLCLLPFPIMPRLGAALARRAGLSAAALPGVKHVGHTNGEVAQ